MKNLFEENLNLAYHVVHKCFPASYQDDDVKQHALIGLWKASQRFDPNLNIAFSTFAFRVIYNELAVYFRKNNRHVYVSLDTPLSEEEEDLTLLDTLADPTTPEDIDDDIDFWDRFNKVYKVLNPRQLYVLKQTISGYSQDEIAEQLALKRASISHIVRHIRAMLKGEKPIKYTTSWGRFEPKPPKTAPKKDLKGIRK